MEKANKEGKPVYLSFQTLIVQVQSGNIVIMTDFITAIKFQTLIVQVQSGNRWKRTSHY